MGKLTHFTFCFFLFFLFILYCSTINSSFKCCYWSFFVKILPLPCPQPLMLLQCTQLDAGRMSSTAGPALRRHKGVWGVCACRKGMRETEYMCVLSLIRKFNWMEFGSFPPPPPFGAGCNKQTFLSPFHPSVVCSSASALLALSLLTAILIRKPEPGGKWRDCIDTADHWAPNNWQLFLPFTSGDGLNRLCKI